MGAATLRQYIGDMEDFLLMFVDLLFEVLIQVVGEAILGMIVRSSRNAIKKSEPISPVLAAVGYLVLGAACGVVSIFFFPHPLIHPSRIHGISLLVSPVITGLIMAQVGLLLRRKDKNTVGIESFWYGFTFAFGVALIRFIFIS